MSRRRRPASDRPRRTRLLPLVGLLVLLPTAPATAQGQVARVEPIDAVPAGPSVAERLAEIQRRIQAALVYPPAARERGLAGVAELEFAIGPSGRARDLRLVASSGHDLLDQAARESVVAAGALPQLGGRLRVPVRYDLAE